MSTLTFSHEHVASLVYCGALPAGLVKALCWYDYSKGNNMHGLSLRRSSNGSVRLAWLIYAELGHG